jgi:hypothetical protein
MCKVPDTVIKGILTDPKWGISRSILKEGRSREVDEYVDRQIHRAHRAYEAWLRKSDFPDDGVELLYQDMFDDEQVSEQAGGQEAEAKPRRREYSLQEAREWRDPKFIIDGLIPYDGTVVIYGPPKSFKTYAASSIAMHAAMGKDFYGQECTKRVVVTYVAAEGGRVNFRDRCLAWCKEHNVDYNDTTGWFWMVTEPVNLTDEKDLRRFVNELRDNQRRGIIFFDTLAKNSGSADEDTAGMKDACEGANWVRLQTGATVVLIHHEGKDPSRGVRGSTVLLGDVDIAIRIVKDVKNKLKPKCLMRIEAARAIRDGKTWMFEPTNHVIDDSLGEEMALHFLNSWGPDENRPTEKSEAGDTALPHQAEPKFVDDFVILKLYELQEGRTRTQLMADGGWKKTALYNAVAELAEHKLVAIDKKSGIVTMTQGGRDAALLFGAERRGEDAEMDTDYGLD